MYQYCASMRGGTTRAVELGLRWATRFVRKTKERLCHDEYCHAVCPSGLYGRFSAQCWLAVSSSPLVRRARLSSGSTGWTTRLARPSSTSSARRELQARTRGSRRRALASLPTWTRRPQRGRTRYESKLTGSLRGHTTGQMVLSAAGRQKEGRTDAPGRPCSSTTSEMGVSDRPDCSNRSWHRRRVLDRVCPATYFELGRQLEWLSRFHRSESAGYRRTVRPDRTAPSRSRLVH